MKTTLTLDNYGNLLMDTKNINFDFVTSEYILSDDFIRKYQDDLKWTKVSWSQPLSESIIREFQDKVNWTLITSEQKISENFIREFSHKVNWNYLSWAQKLSEDFIEEFADKVNWLRISAYQELSEEFIENNLERLDIIKLAESRSLSDEFCKKHKIECNILSSVFHCGTEHRCIYRTKDEPDLINIGCFKGTKREAKAAISKKYKGEKRKDYIAKVEKCFSI